MSLGRRSFLKRSLATSALLALPASCRAGAPEAQQVLVNHLGFVVDCSKYCLAQGSVARRFSVVETVSGKVVLEGTMTPREGDLGIYVIGDLTDLKQPGVFELRSDSVH